jgi:ribosomal protein L31E
VPGRGNFRQSEQIPTRVRLAVAEQVEDGTRAWRAGGLLMGLGLDPGVVLRHAALAEAGMALRDVAGRQVGLPWGFEEAAHQYFRQSEQIPTRVRLAVAEQVEDGTRRALVDGHGEVAAAEEVGGAGAGPEGGEALGVEAGGGEAAALTALLGSSLKFEGRFQLQTKTDGPVDMVVVGSG